MTAENPLRLFVAIELPEAWLDALEDLQARIKAALTSDAAVASARPRWVRPEGIHLTLKFIGEVAPDRLDAIKAQLAAAVPAPRSITLSLGQVGAFEDRRAPRVLWVGLDAQPEQALAKLAGDIDASLAVAGITRERRPFAPHLTLARLPDGIPDAQRRRIAEIAQAVEATEARPFRVEGISLMQSFLSPTGARYERLARVPFGAKPS